MEHTPKKRFLAHHFACHCKKLTIYGGYFCCFFLFHVKPAGVFGVILRFFGNFKPLKNICLPVFWLFHVKHRVFFSVLCNFFDCRLVFICFCCVFGLIWLIINGFCCFFSCFTWNLSFSLAIFAFLWLFLLVMLRFFCFSWFFWGYFLVLDGFYYVFAFNGCTYLKF